MIPMSESRKDIVVWGAGGHARVVLDVLRQNGFQIAGVIDDENTKRAGEEFCGAKIFSDIGPLAGRVPYAFIAIGGNLVREQKARMVLSKGFTLALAIHPRAVVAADVELGAGSIVMAGAVINPGARIGGNVIINTSASVDHDCVIGDAVHVSPGAHIAGAVRIGRQAWVGIGASVIDRITIGERSIIGAGAAVIRDVPDDTVAVGVPARETRRVDAMK